MMPGPTRVPLLMTSSFVMASSAAFEQGVMAFLGGGDFAAIRAGGTAGYARGQRAPRRARAARLHEPVGPTLAALD
jgi:hypothetical protein